MWLFYVTSNSWLKYCFVKKVEVVALAGYIGSTYSIQKGFYFCILYKNIRINFKLF